MTFDELLTLPLPKRIEWLHGPDGPRGKLSHDRFAEILGTTRQTVIGWERGTEPKTYAGKLAEFSGFPREAFLRRGAEVAAEESSLRLLRELRAMVEAQGEATTKTLDALARDVRLLLRQQGGADGPAKAAGS